MFYFSFSPPLSNAGSNCSTPVQNSPPVSFSPTHRITYAQNSPLYGSVAQNHDRRESVVPPPYVNPPQYRQTSTLPGNAVPFNSTSSLRSSLRQTSLPRQISSNSIASSNSSSSSRNSSNGFNVNVQNSPVVQRKVNFQEPLSPKKNKKISFNLTPQEVPPLPKKPPPPKRAETTKLSSPKKLVEPPLEFLKDLQRVMRKKWQVSVVGTTLLLTTDDK